MNSSALLVPPTSLHSLDPHRNQKLQLSREQRDVIEAAKEGYNVVVDACWGSGKTTVIQALCDELAQLPDKPHILYLTFNKLLKAEARWRIHAPHTMVTNYHGLAWDCLQKNNLAYVTQDDIFDTYLKYRDHCKQQIYCPSIIIIDEYQDISSQYTPVIHDAIESLWLLRGVYPQIIAVGDMDQKLYDQSSLDPEQYIHNITHLDSRPTEKLALTQSFRLCPELADAMGSIFKKEINGMNINGMAQAVSFGEVIDILSEITPEDLICLGGNDSNTSRRTRTRIQNTLEEKYPDTWNKATLFSTIREMGEEIVRPKDDASVFSTYDRAKGLERRIAVVCDYTSEYWRARIHASDVPPRIIRNIFGVAATRGRDCTLFVRPIKTTSFAVPKFLPESTLREATQDEAGYKLLGEIPVTDAYNYKHDEDIDAAYAAIQCERLDTENSEKLEGKLSDGYIDLSAAVGIWAATRHFVDSTLDDRIRVVCHSDAERRRWEMVLPDLTDEQKARVIIALVTGQRRYYNQVFGRFMNEDTEKKLVTRLAEKLPKNAPCEVPINFSLKLDPKYSQVAREQQHIYYTGFADVVHENIIWELKFVQNLSRQHFLQLATYLLGKPQCKEGRLWNLRTNELWSVKIKDRERFAKTLVEVSTKGVLSGEALKEIVTTQEI